jgi:glutamyl-Q tRNA(Asp) synthetase
LRIDDLDTPRNEKFAADNILKTLDALCLYWDGDVDYQSQHIDEYDAALSELAQQEKIYRCLCSRKELTKIYNQTCRNQFISINSVHALRIKTDEQRIRFTDHLQGERCHHMKEYGDFILKRKDNIIAYQLAVVIDDARHHINHIIRGIDLLDETPKQLFLQQCLNYPSPYYAHVPILVDGQGFKLSKQTRADAINIHHANQILFDLLMLLKQSPPLELQNSSKIDILSWAIANWDISKLTGLHQQPLI